MTKMETLVKAVEKLAEAINHANDVARELGATEELYTLQSNQKVWKKVLKHAHESDKHDMVTEVLFPKASRCIQ